MSELRRCLMKTMDIIRKIYRIEADVFFCSFFVSIACFALLDESLFLLEETCPESRSRQETMSNRIGSEAYIDWLLQAN
jgi:hypothetical protein